MPISNGMAHTYIHIHTLAHSLIVVMDGTRQSSDKDAGAREVNHFAQVVFHTEKNETSEASWKAARQACNILQPTQLRAEIFLVFWSSEGCSQLYHSLATAAQPRYIIPLVPLN